MCVQAAGIGFMEGYESIAFLIWHPPRKLINVFSQDVAPVL